MRFFSLLVLLSASCSAMETENRSLPRNIESKFINFCQIIQQRDVIYDFGNQDSIPGKVFTPRDSFELSRHLKAGGSYRYSEPETDLMFQLPYSIEKVAGSCSVLFHHKKNTGKNTLNFFLKELGSHQSIIDGYKNWDKSEIKEFACNVLTIIERDHIILRQKTHDIVKPALEIGALVLTSERLRSEKSLLLAYIEFLKLRHDPSSERLGSMFLGEPTLRFPGGQDRIFFTPIKELFLAFSDLYTVCKPDDDTEKFFDDVIWNLWKLHELHWDFGYVLREFDSPLVNPCVSYVISALINSAPNQLNGKLFDKNRSPIEIIKSAFQMANREYCKFIFAAAPEISVEVLLNNDSLYNCLKSLVDRENPDTLCADWILAKIDAQNRNASKHAIMSLLNKVIECDIYQITHFSFSKLIQYTNDSNERRNLLKHWLEEKWKRKHLKDHLVKAIVDEYLCNKALKVIFNMAVGLKFFNETELIEAVEKELKINYLEAKSKAWIEKFGSGINERLERFRARVLPMATPELESLFE